MDFSRLYSACLTHPKWIVLSDSAQALLVRAWMYAAGQETNGHIPGAAGRIIGVRAKTATELEQHCWWHRNGDGWELHDWLDHQPAAEDIKRKRQLARDRKRRERERRAEA